MDIQFAAISIGVKALRNLGYPLFPRNRFQFSGFNDLTIQPGGFGVLVASFVLGFIKNIHPTYRA